MDKPDENGNQYIIVIIDCFSRWVQLKAVPDLSAISAAKSLLEFVGNFGVPDEIQADLGTQYVNELIQEFIKFTGSTVKFNIAAHSKEANAIVERTNKEVLRHLRGIIFERNFISDWSNNLPMVQRIINATKHESIGCSPAQILFGNAINLNNQIFLPSDERPWNISLPTWLSDKIAVQDAIIKRAQAIQKVKDDRHMLTTSRDITSYDVNDYVLVEYPATNLKKGPPSKLLTNLRGPMQVINKEGSHYTLRDLVSHKDEVIHIKRLHPFYYDVEHTDPKQIACKDKQEFEIQSIEEHQGNRYEPSTMQFKVKWKPINDNESVVTWEILKTLRASQALHEYLKANKMKSLIPPAYKNQELQKRERQCAK